jgi:hypothetical protein
MQDGDRIRHRMRIADHLAPRRPRVCICRRVLTHGPSIAPSIRQQMPGRVDSASPWAVGPSGTCIG